MRVNKLNNIAQLALLLFGSKTFNGSDILIFQ